MFCKGDKTPILFSIKLTNKKNKKTLKSFQLKQLFKQSFLTLYKLFKK